MTYLNLLTALEDICEGNETTKGTVFEEVSQFDEINDLKALLKFAEYLTTLK